MLPVEVKQVTVTQFPLLDDRRFSQQMRVDRCQSCHIGLENPQMTAENIIQAVDGVSLTADKVAGLSGRAPGDARPGHDHRRTPRH